MRHHCTHSCFDLTTLSGIFILLVVSIILVTHIRPHVTSTRTQLLFQACTLHRFCDNVFFTLKNDKTVVGHRQRLLVGILHPGNASPRRVRRLKFHVIRELLLGACLVPIRVELLLEAKVTQVVAKVRLGHCIMQPDTKQVLFTCAQGVDIVRSLAEEAGDRHVNAYGGLEFDSETQIDLDG